MNIHLKVSEWLEAGRPFAVGVAILEEAIAGGYKCASINIIRASVKSKNPNSLAKSKLHEALLEVQAQNNQEEFKTVKDFGFTDPSVLPPDLVELQDDLRGMLKRMDMLRGQLRLIYYTFDGSKIKNPSESQGRAIASEIQKTFLKTKSLWPKIDYFTQFGHHLPGTEPVSTNPERLIYLLKVQIQNADYLSKCRTRLRKGYSINQLKYDACLAIEREIKTLTQ